MLITTKHTNYTKEGCTSEALTRHFLFVCLVSFVVSISEKAQVKQ